VRALGKEPAELSVGGVYELGTVKSAMVVTV
jgi:hypothetical protein